jgi:predicted nucleic acid-binding protein
VVYLDSSAIVKLIVAEPESTELQRYLAQHRGRATCSLAKVEVTRAVRAHGTAALRRTRNMLRRLDLVTIDDELLDDAATLDAGVLRSLDAIHLAAARIFGDDLVAVVTYDARMAKAAEHLGLPVEAPGRDLRRKKKGPGV